jgi:lipase
MRRAVASTVATGPDGLHYRYWGDPQSSEIAVAIHGLTANGEFFVELAQHLPPGIALVAPDLRGRGLNWQRSTTAGIAGHGADLAELLRHLGRRYVLLGHSLGATIALTVPDDLRAQCDGLILIDGGPPFPISHPVGRRGPVHSTFGAAIARAESSWGSAADVTAWWRSFGPLATAQDDAINAIAAAEVVADVEGSVRLRLDLRTIERDASDLLTDRNFRELLQSCHPQTVLLLAESGLDWTRPALFPQEMMIPDPHCEVRRIGGSNHYDILLSPAHAAVIAAQMGAFTGTQLEPMKEQFPQ